jgi:hypothetical protein
VVDDDEDKEGDKKDEDKKEKKTRKEKRNEWELLNDVKAIWLRKAKDIKEEEYQAFYKAISKVGRGGGDVGGVPNAYAETWVGVGCVRRRGGGGTSRSGGGRHTCIVTAVCWCECDIEGPANT